MRISGLELPDDSEAYPLLRITGECRPLPQLLMTSARLNAAHSSKCLPLVQSQILSLTLTFKLTSTQTSSDFPSFFILAESFRLRCQSLLLNCEVPGKIIALKPQYQTQAGYLAAPKMVSGGTIRPCTRGLALFARAVPFSSCRLFYRDLFLPTHHFLSQSIASLLTRHIQLSLEHHGV